MLSQCKGQNLLFLVLYMITILLPFTLVTLNQILIVLYGRIGDCPALKLLWNMSGHEGYFCCSYFHLKGVHNAEARK